MASVDMQALRARHDIGDVVGRYVELRGSGDELTGRCPFHAERTPSFTVSRSKGFVHCFGCGAHHDLVGFLMALLGVDFRSAVQMLGEEVGPAQREASPLPAQREASPPGTTWVALMPVPEDAPNLLTASGWTVPVWNPRRGKAKRLRPSRVDGYRDAAGRLLGFVVRADIRDRESGAAQKWTPMITWCVSRDGAQQWCLQGFPIPRPLLGLDDLAARPDAPVLVVEGEKCRAAAARAWPQYVAVCWPGGSNGIEKSDWSPLHGRDVVLWPDADEAGRRAMVGHCNDAGDFRAGVAHLVARAGSRSIALIDPAGQPRGWDVADALERDGWSPRQAAAWAASRRVELRVVAA